MGRIFLEHLGGIRIFSCASCDTYLTNRSELISTRFTGATGRAFLFHRVVNLEHSDPQERVMLTGRHIVRDVSCKVCKTKLGWIYEFATEEPQRYKEGRIILERALVTEADGFEEHSDDDSNRTQDHGSPHSSGGVSVEDNNSGSGAVLAHALISAPIAQAHAVQHGSAHMAAAAAMLQHAQQAAFNVLHHGPPPPPPRL